MTEKKDKTLFFTETNTFLNLGTVMILIAGIWYISGLEARTESNQDKIIQNKARLEKHDDLFVQEQKEAKKAAIRYEKRLSTIETKIDRLIRYQRTRQ